MPTLYRTKASGTAAASLLDRLPAEDRKTAVSLIDQTVGERCKEGYRKTAEMYERLYGGITFTHVMKAIRIETDKPTSEARAPATFRSQKSALVHESLVRGTPWEAAETALVDLVLEGYTTHHGPRRRRGAVDRAMLEPVIAQARADERPGVAEALIVLQRCILRPQDIDEMCVKRVDLEAGVVSARRKGGSARITKEGALEPHVIPDDETRSILKMRVDLAHTVAAAQDIPEPEECLLFPDWDRAYVSELMRRVSVQEGWPEDLIFDGAHCVRHGGAAEVYRAALEAARQQGAWASMASAEHYATSGRLAPGEPKLPARRAKPATRAATRAARGPEGRAGKRGAASRGAVRLESELQGRRLQPARTGPRSESGRRR